GAHDGSDLAVEMPTHRYFLRRRLRMEIDEDDSRPRAQRLDLPQHYSERIVDTEHEHAAHHVDDADRSAFAVSPQVAAVSRHAARVIRRPKQTCFRTDVIERFFLVPDVIARGHHIDPVLEQLIADLARDAEAGRGVFGIGNYEVDAVMLNDGAKAALHKIATGAPDDVTDEENAHAQCVGRAEAAV